MLCSGCLILFMIDKLNQYSFADYYFFHDGFKFCDDIF
jgi:hypothetical protein